MYGSFLRDKSGAVALLFGLTFAVIVAAVGAAVDYGNALRIKSKVQNALDSAALAAAREFEGSGKKRKAVKVGRDHLLANLGSGFPASSLSFNIKAQGQMVTATASGQVDTFILGFMGIKDIEFGAETQVAVGGGTAEIALVLDNSGSMAGHKLASLQKAAKKLTRVVFESARNEKVIHVGLVPFAGAVNVGSDKIRETWMDTQALSSTHDENLGKNGNRFEAYDEISNVNWGGCVEVRPVPHDVLDSTPSPGDGDSYFVPMFAPDEPDGDHRYMNSYVSDTSPWCKKLPAKWQWICKYRRKKANTSHSYGTQLGPNFLCDSQAVTALTNKKGDVINAIERMRAQGSTNIHDAVMWGWRLLSPNEPFEEGRPYEEPLNKKIMVVMSDGSNNHIGLNNPYLSIYSSYGYAANGRLGIATNNSMTLIDAMNGKTATACENAKAAGVTIYTVAFDLNDKETLKLLRGCASTPSMAFTISGSGDLLSAFESIGKSINQLRIAK